MTASILEGHVVSADKLPPFDVLEFGKKRVEITGGKGHLGEVFPCRERCVCKVKAEMERKH